MKKCILHIGQPKTGTTAVRKTYRLEDNQKYLLDNNVYATSLCFQRTGGGQIENNLIYGTCDAVQLSGGVSIPLSVYQDITGKQSITSEEQVENWKYENYTLFISDELLCMMPTHIAPIWTEYYEEYVEQLSQLIKQDLGFEEVEVVLFLREQSQLLESWWRQMMFKHDIYKFKNFSFKDSIYKLYDQQGLKENLFNGYNIAATYSKYFDNIKIYPYKSGETLNTINGILGIDGTKLTPLDTETPQHYSLELADFITQYLPTEKQIEDINPPIVRDLDNEVDVEHFKGSCLSKEDRQAIMDTWSETNQKLVDTFNLDSDFFSTQQEYALSLEQYQRVDGVMEKYYEAYIEKITELETSNDEGNVDNS